MEAIRIEQIVGEDGEVVITGLPFRKGQSVEITLIAQPEQTSSRPHLTVKDFRELGLIGLWKERTDIEDSSTYARQLREEAQQRRHIDYDLPGQ